MKNKKRTFTILIILLALFLFLSAGRFLDYNQQPVHSDAIIMLGGGDGERALKASQLYKAHYANKVILSNGGTRNHPDTTAAMQEMDWLMADGVPRTAIILELHSLSTYGNAVYTKKIMKQRHFKSAIVVSSNYHMRRAHYIFTKLYRGTDIRLTYCSAAPAYYNPNRWWMTKIGWMFTVSEYVKLIGYHIVYGWF